MKCRIDILEDVIAKQHIRELCNQQIDLINHNIKNNILFQNIPEDPRENVRLRQNPDGLYNDPITTRLIINKSVVEVMGIDLKVMHDMLFECLHRLGKCVQGKNHSIIVNLHWMKKCKSLGLKKGV